MLNVLKLAFPLAFLFSSSGYSMESFCYYQLAQLIQAHTVVQKLELKEAKEIELPTALKTVVDSDPLLQTLINDKDFIQYFLGVIDGKSIKDLQPVLHSIWKNGKTDKASLYVLIQNKILPALNKSEAPEKNEFLAKLREFAGPTPKARLSFHIRRIVDQIKALPRTLRKAKSLIDEDLSPNFMDSRVFDAYGYLNLQLESSRLRPWEKVKGLLSGINVSEVSDIDPTAFTKIAMLASEIEVPIEAYSDNSGETFRVISPQMSRFMGKTTEEAQAMEQNRKTASYCTNSWCYEESRHAGTLKGIAQRIVGWNLTAIDPFTSYEGLDPFSSQDALFHLYARNSTEWNAMSAYFILGSHSDGTTAAWTRNVRRDEIKHMSVFLGFYKYIHGNRPNLRFLEMVKKAMAELNEKGTESEYGDQTKDPVTGLEFVYISMAVEKKIRGYLATLPLKTVRKIYETQVNLPPLPAVAIDPAKEARLKVEVEKEKQNRLELARWNPKERAYYGKLEEAEKRLSSVLGDLIINKLNTFAGAEDYGSSKDIEYRNQIDNLFVSGVNKKDLALVKQSLRETLRDYQIMNNQDVRKLGLKVQFLNPQQGFDIVKDETFASLPKVKGIEIGKSSDN